MKSICCYGSVHQNAYRLQNYPVTVAFVQRATKLSAQLIFINEVKQVCQGAQHYHLNKGGKEAGNSFSMVYFIKIVLNTIKSPFVKQANLLKVKLPFKGIVHKKCIIAENVLALRSSKI